MTWRLSQAHDAGLEEVEVSATVHLTFDELQLADLAFGLPVEPRTRPRSLGPTPGPAKLDRRRYRKRTMPTGNAIRANNFFYARLFVEAEARSFRLKSARHLR
jgi:hypothetical protein